MLGSEFPPATGSYIHDEMPNKRYSYLNEEEVGTGLREFLSKNPSIKRTDIFITTKVWPHLSEPEDVEWSLNNSLEMLGTNYVDCFLIHVGYLSLSSIIRDIAHLRDAQITSQHSQRSFTLTMRVAILSRKDG